MVPSTNNQAHITNHLLTKSLPVSARWLSEFLSSSRSDTPLAALTQTALFRLLASDFTQTLSPTNPACFLPSNISDPAVKTRKIVGPVPLQVLDIVDIGCSRWSQVEAIERVERGEETRGREVIRTVNRDLDSSGGERQPESGNKSTGPHKLILQDAKGTRVEAFELKKVEGVAIGQGGLSIGAKMVLRNVTVARGMVMLEPGAVAILGGKIESMDRIWREKRKSSLLDPLSATDDAMDVD